MPKLAGLWNKCREDNGFRLSDWLCHSPQCLCFIVSGFYVQPEQIIPGLISNSDLMYYRLWSINGLWTGNWLRARLGKALHGVFWKKGCIGWSKFLFLILYPTHGNSQEDLPHGLRRGRFCPEALERLKPLRERDPKLPSCSEALSSGSEAGKQGGPVSLCGQGFLWTAWHLLTNAQLSHYQLKVFHPH